MTNPFPDCTAIQRPDGSWYCIRCQASFDDTHELEHDKCVNERDKPAR